MKRSDVHTLLSAALAGLHEKYVLNELPHLGGPVPVVPRRGPAA